jgi:DNA-binding NarL/FixJ family response regulator
VTTQAPVPLRVVIADDQASVREGLVLLLGGLPGIEVVGAAADGEQALAQVAEHHPDAILLDLNMPVLNGIGATRRLVAEHPAVAIVVLTTYIDDTNVLEALKAGARSYLTKDADRTDIARALQAAAAGLTVFDPRVHDTLLAATTSPVPAAPDLGPAPRALPDGLTHREAEILALIARALQAAAAGLTVFDPRVHDTLLAATTSPVPAAPDLGPAPRTLPDGLTHREAEILALIARGLTNPEIAQHLCLSNHTIKSHINRIFTKTQSRDRAAAIGYAHRHQLT